MGYSTRKPPGCQRRKRTCSGEARGLARIASYTVLYEGERPSQNILLCDLEDGRRALVASQDEDLARSLLREEACGRRVRLSPGGDVALA